jgi:hypothetical protein
MVELQLPKLIARVRFPSLAPQNTLYTLQQFGATPLLGVRNFGRLSGDAALFQVAWFGSSSDTARPDRGPTAFLHMAASLSAHPGSASNTFI